MGCLLAGRLLPVQMLFTFPYSQETFRPIGFLLQFTCFKYQYLSNHTPRCFVGQTGRRTGSGEGGEVVNLIQPWALISHSANIPVSQYLLIRVWSTWASYVHTYLMYIWQKVDRAQPGTLWSNFLWKNICNLVLCLMFALSDILLQWQWCFIVFQLEFYPKAGCYCPLFHNVSYLWLDIFRAATIRGQTRTQRNLNSPLKKLHWGFDHIKLLEVLPTVFHPELYVNFCMRHFIF